MRFVPEIVMVVPPVVGPWFGVIREIVGTATKVNPFARLAVPLGVVSDTVEGPAVPAGVIAETVAGVMTVTFVAATPPM